MRITLKKSVGLVAATILALGAMVAVTPTAGTGDVGHRTVADHQGPASVTP